MMRCPGQDPRFWKLGDIFDVECPHCGTAVEFWKDEPSVKCPQCRKAIVNPKLDLGCAQWCQHAERCLGTLSDPQGILCKKLIKEMKSVLGQKQERIDHALTVFRNTQQILACEQGDARIVNAAAILHVLVGPCPARANLPTAGFDAYGGLSAVQEILARCGVDTQAAERICSMAAHHPSAKSEDSIESKILWDAEWLTRLGDHPADIGAVEAKEFIERTFRTCTGRDLAMTLLMVSDGRLPPQAV